MMHAAVPRSEEFRIEATMLLFEYPSNAADMATQIYLESEERDRSRRTA